VLADLVLWWIILLGALVLLVDLGLGSLR